MSEKQQMELHEKKNQKMLKSWPRISLKLQLYLVLVVFLIGLTVVTISSISDYSRLQREIFRGNLTSYSNQLYHMISQSYETYEQISYSVAYNQSVQTYLTAEDPDEKYESYQLAASILFNAMNLDPYIVDLAVINPDGNSIAVSGSPRIYQEFLESYQPSATNYQSMGLLMINGSVECQILAMPVYRLANGENAYLGMMFLALNPSALFGGDRLEADYDPTILFLDEDGRLIFGEEELYQELSDTLPTSEKTTDSAVTLTSSQSEYTCSSFVLTNVKSRLYVLIDSGIYLEKVREIAFRQLLWMGLILILICGTLIFLYQPLIHSLRRLTSTMQKITSGERKALSEGVLADFPPLTCSEVADLTTSFNDMLKESKRLNYTIFQTYTKMYDLEMNNRRTEIAFLRSQINPHFLYNTLTTICGLASADMNDEIIEVTNALSQIFRYSIKGQEIVTLREELEIVKSYLTIQSMRFEDRFTIRYEIAEDSLDCQIPKMIIQPLVENAIVHGLERKLEKGELLIGSGRNPEHGYLAIWIYDTGVGMPKEKLEQLRHAVTHSMEAKSGDASRDLKELDAQNHDSIGILNVNNRMVLYYGKEYTLLIDSEEQVGTNIQIRVPFRTDLEPYTPVTDQAIHSDFFFIPGSTPLPQSGEE